MCCWHQFDNNPENPKNVKITFASFMVLSAILDGEMITQLTDDMTKAIEIVRREFKQKKQCITNRQAYTAIVHAADAEDKQAAIENYLMTRKMTGRG